MLLYYQEDYNAIKYSDTGEKLMILTAAPCVPVGVHVPIFSCCSVK